MFWIDINYVLEIVSSVQVDVSVTSFDLLLMLHLDYSKLKQDVCISECNFCMKVEPNWDIQLTARRN
jgi:hypothetical protein